MVPGKSVSDNVVTIETVRTMRVVPWVNLDLGTSNCIPAPPEWTRRLESSIRHLADGPPFCPLRGWLRSAPLQRTSRGRGPAAAWASRGGQCCRLSA
jgi:hypothetical protein